MDSRGQPTPPGPTVQVAGWTGQSRALVFIPELAAVADWDHLAFTKPLPTPSSPRCARSVSDTAAALTGLTVRARAMPTGAGVSRCAALIEQAWVDADQGLGSPLRVLASAPELPDVLTSHPDRSGT